LGKYKVGTFYAAWCVPLRFLDWGAISSALPLSLPFLSHQTAQLNIAAAVFPVLSQEVMS